MRIRARDIASEAPWARNLGPTSPHALSHSFDNTRILPASALTFCYGKHMARLSQFNLFSRSALASGTFTPPARGNPKGPRPFSKRASLHVVLKSSRAQGAHSLLRRERAVRAVLERQAARFDVQLQGVANAGNHLHLLLRAPTRERLANFLRATSGIIARLVLGQLGRARAIPDGSSSSGRNIASRFWDTRPFSRLVGPGRDWRGVRDYLELNQLEAQGASREIARDVLQLQREAMSPQLRLGLISRGPSHNDI